MIKMFGPHLTDYYKTGHRKMYPPGTEYVYSNFTCRSDKWANVLSDFDHKVVFFGLQGACQWLLRDLWNETFFEIPKAEALEKYKNRMDSSLGPGAVSVDHIAALHDLGYLPVLIKALPEGSRVNIRVPLFTIINTLPEFYWVTNYLETQLSAVLWGPITSATIAFEYRRLLEKYADETGGDKNFIPWQGHDFSMRGMFGLEAGITSGAAHLLSFTGTDTIPAIDYLEEYYNATGLIGGSVPACYDSETEVLTSKGFRKFEDVIHSDKVAQYHEDGSLSFVNPKEIYKCPYNGDLVHFKKQGNKYIDIRVTPNHRMVRRKAESGAISLFEAGATDYRLRQGYSHRYGMVVSGLSKGVKIALSPLEKLKIAFQADGSFASHAEDYNGLRSGKLPIRFSLKKKRKIERLSSILNQGAFSYTKSPQNNGYWHFWIQVEEEFVKDFSWVDLSEVSFEWAQEFVKELSHWDGCKRTGKSVIKYSSTTQVCVEIAQAVGAVGGYNTHRYEYLDPRGDRKKIFDVSFTPKTYVTGDGTEKTLEPYSGYVYCVSVPTKMLVTRRNGVVAVSGNTEHSVVCMGGFEDELETFRRLIEDVYPSGIVSLVSDTWDYFEVITKFTVQLKDKILGRNGKVVFRPDSGDPVKIICGDPEAVYGTPEYKGSVECLWEVFGGTRTEKGFRKLDSHVGLIYGDSITLERAQAILQGLKNKNFSSDNIVFGIGSYTYTFVTRDTFGSAIKATWGRVKGQSRELFKEPKTDNGVKKSARGWLRVEKQGNDFVLHDRQHTTYGGELKIVFRDGLLYNTESLQTIRERLLSSLTKTNECDKVIK